MAKKIDLEAKLKAKEEFDWFALTFGLFVLLVVLFNSQSFVNYATTKDVSGNGAKLRNLANSWHELMSDIGFAGPRRFIEDLKSPKAENSKRKTLAK